LLNKGLTFCPSPGSTPKKQFLEGSLDFSRRLKIIYNEQFESNTKHLQFEFRVPSEFVPQKFSYPPEIDLLETSLKNTINQLPNKNKITDNLTIKERKALKQLKNNDSIVIKKADKGSAIVIQNKTDYCQEAERQLNNKQHYKPISAPIFPAICQQYNSILKEMLKYKLISSKVFNYLLARPDARERFFYLLPKIHKTKDKWINNIPPGRPIVSDINSESYRIARFVDFYLSPVCNLHPSYVKNTYHFLNKIKDTQVGADDLLITLDVESLYTNIDTNLGLTAIKEALSQKPKLIHGHILKLLQLCLEGNDFTFNGKNYLQIHGTAMGRTFAPKYADIVMAALEKQALNKCEKQPSLYLRYLDDIFLIWPHSIEDFNQFLQIFNNEHTSINFKANIQPHTIEFLDVLVFKGENFNKNHLLDTKVFFKETDSHSLLHKSSFHPKHVFSGLVKSQLIRFARICVHRRDFDEACHTLFTSLKNRYYSNRFLRHIKNSIVHEWYPPNQTNLFPCSKLNCTICPYLPNRDTLYSDNGRIPLPHLGSCQSKSCLFAAQCSSCNETMVVGFAQEAMGNLISTFLNGGHQKDLEFLSLHFSNPGHTGTPVFTILEYINNPSEATPNKLKWSKRLKCLTVNSDKSSQSRDNKTPFILNFHPFSQSLKNTTKNWQNTHNQQIGSPFIKRPVEILHAYARNRNLSNSLVRSRLPPS